MKRLERLYALNEAIRRQAPRPVSAARLATDFDVSRRTIERDLAALRRAGVPLYADRGRSGGQRSLDRTGNVVVTLSTAEVTALLVAVAAGGPDMPFADAGASATARLLDGLPPSTRVGVEHLRNRIRAYRSPGQVTKRIRRTIEDAVQRGVVVNVDYVDATGTETERAVDAVGLYQGGDGWYLLGWCHLRAAGRIFRLDRIRSARATRRPIEERDVDDTLGWTPHDVTTP